MAGLEERARAVQRAVERLAEDERLRSDLTDPAASAALAWAEQRLRDGANSAPPQADAATIQAAVEAQFKQVRATLRALNDLTAARRTLPPAELVARLTALLPDHRAAAPQAEALATEQATLSDEAWVRRVLGLVGVPAGRPPPLVSHLAPAAAAPRPPAQGRAGAPSFASFARNTRWFLIGAGVLGLLLCGCLLLIALLLPRLLAPESAPLPTRPTVAASPTPPLPSPTGWYELFFTEPFFPDDPARHTGSVDNALAAFIGRASRTVDMAIYQLDLPAVVEALLDARERGVTVRVITDIDTLEDPGENEAFLALEAAGIPVVGGNSDAIMHNKFVVVDGAAVWTGSWNFTANDTYRYNNNAIAIQSPELASNYRATFQKMWFDRTFGEPREPGGTQPILSIQGVTVENYFAPENEVTERLAQRLMAAQRSIDFMAFSFTEDLLGDAILARAEQGVAVRGVFENTGSNTQFSEYGRLREAGLDVLQDGNPYLMHHKVFVIDGQSVVLGSFNFSANAQDSNDENLLIIDDAALAARFLEQFERVRFQALNPPNR